ncbi:MAG TPA: glycosyltransferase family 4 protein [Puia sp.]|jgi:glycosyltransferase involved in cell wall biosynthesis|nr:glycosyltransferase family 4 protein [Puia sp.]
MKILYICEEYPPGKNGGIGTMVRVLGREMVRQGHTVYVIGLYIHGFGGADYEEDEGVKVWRLRYGTDAGWMRDEGSRLQKILLKALKFSMILQLDTLFSVGRLFRRISRMVREEGIDVIEMPDWNTFFQNSFLRINIPSFGAPLLVKFHGTDSYFRHELGRSVNPHVFALESALLRRADALASVSRYTAARTAALFALTRPIEILYNSIKLPQLRDRASVDPRKVIFTGSLLYKKGIYSLMEAWNIVALEHPDAALHIYGKGDADGLKKLLDPRTVKSVFFHGHVSREVLFGELATAAAAVFPSYSECFALAPMEAMAVGCAVVNSTRSSGPELVTDRVDGLLADPDRPEQIAAAIGVLLTDPVFRDSIAAAGKATVESKFNIQQSVPQHIAFYNKMINDFANTNPLNKT